MFPLGRGQRELILGDRGTGKDTLARGIVINQKRTNRWLSPDGRGRKRLFSLFICLGTRGIDGKYLQRFLQGRGTM
jgi:F-type H+-transporting ATPase subunit alpha